MTYTERYEELRGCAGYEAGELDEAALAAFGVEDATPAQAAQVADRIEAMLRRGQTAPGPNGTRISPATMIEAMDRLRSL